MTDVPAPKPPHFVSKEPWDPYVAEKLTAEQERFYMASQWRMMWWKLKRHRLAVISGAVLMVLYGSNLISEFLAPYALNSRHNDFLCKDSRGADRHSAEQQTGGDATYEVTTCACNHSEMAFGRSPGKRRRSIFGDG